MGKTCKIFIIMIFVVTTERIRPTCSTKPPTCCTPDQWEATMFWDNGNCFVDDLSRRPKLDPGVGTLVSYINGSIKTAYDFVNGRTFINATVMQISPLLPKPVMQQTMLIRDYKDGIEYQIDAASNKCDKSRLDLLKRHCIPGEAVNLGTGTLGKKGVPVSTFAYTLSDYPFQFQSTVTQTGCLPVHVTYLDISSEAGSGAMYSLDVSDVTPGIRDPSIFDVPPQCKSGQRVQKSSRWLHPFF